MPVSSVNPTVNPAQSKVKKAAAVVAGATALAAGAAATLVLAKQGKLNPTEGGNKIVESVKALVKKPAEKVLNTVEGSKVFAKVAEKTGAISNKLGKAFEGVKADVETFAANVEGSVKGFAQKHDIPAKAAEAVEGVKADVETFAANVEGSAKGFAQKHDVAGKAAKVVEAVKSGFEKLAGSVKAAK